MAAAITAHDVGRADAAWTEPRRTEPPRLAAVGRPRFIDPSPEPAFDRITRLAALALDAPIALISLVDGGRQWFKSRRGLDLAAVSGDIAFCDHTLHQPDGQPLVVPDAAADARFAESPLVRQPPGIRFYAGAPIRSPDGGAIGTVCVLDTVPRLCVDARDAAILTELAQLARDELDRRLALAEIADAARATAEHAARRSEPLAAVLDATADAVLAITADGRIAAANRGAESLFGYPRAELVGQPMVLLAPERSALALATALRRCLRMTDPRQLGIIEMTARRRDGNELAVEVSLAACTTDSGPGLGVVLRPASLRKAVKAERQRQRDAAELAARAKSDFLANMSHELRTPLNAILGFSELLIDGLQGPVTDRQREYLTGIYRSGSHLLSIVNDILDFAKIEAGRVELDERVVEVPTLFRDCATLLALQALNSGVEVSVALDPAPPPILGDERLLKQILLNLLSNAVKFTATGGRVILSAAPTADGGLTLDIADTGIGMTPDEIRIALEAFRQVDSSLTRRHDGTGLGLPIAKKLTELHGAELLFSSQPGRGTTVTIRLPAWRVMTSLRA